MSTDIAPRGLAGVTAGKTAISSIDGERGELRYRGYAIEDLAGRAGFVEVLGLLIDGELPDDAQHAALRECLGARALPAHVLAMMRALPAATHPMQVLQSVVPHLGDAALAASPRAKNRAVQRRVLLGVIAQMPTALAAWLALREGREPVAPDGALPLWADFLRMLRGGELPPGEDAELLDLVQVLQAEHSFNASTFAVRVVASTQATMPASLSAGVGALSGPLHGGADEAAYRMALAIGAPADAAAWVESALARGERIMGLGHREYRVVDPRAVLLQDQARRLARDENARRVLDVLAEVESACERRFLAQGKRIRANVEFWKGAVLASLGIPSDAFTSMFGLARAAGWGAHALEEWDDPVIIRPQAQYVGPAPRVLAPL